MREGVRLFSFWKSMRTGLMCPCGKDRYPAHHGPGEAQTTSVSVPPKLGKEKDEAHRVRESKRKWARGGRKKRGMVVTSDVTQWY